MNRGLVLKDLVKIQRKMLLLLLDPIKLLQDVTVDGALQRLVSRRQLDHLLLARLDVHMFKIIGCRIAKQSGMSSCGGLEKQTGGYTIFGPQSTCSLSQ